MRENTQESNQQRIVNIWIQMGLYAAIVTIAFFSAIQKDRIESGHSDGGIVYKYLADAGWVKQR